jgi:hypothetical protein
MSDILYKKVGKKYVPQSRVFDFEHAMPVGSFMLVYAHTDGSKQYEYEVTPDTSSFVAAAMVARKAIEDVIRDKSEYKPDPVHVKKFTKKQADIVIDFRKAMREVGGNMPTWWTQSSSHEISKAAIDAVRNYKP